MASRSIICSYPLLPDPLVNIASIVQPSQRDLSENHVRDTCFGRNRLFSPSSLQIACFGSSVVINCRSYFLMASHGQSVVPFIEIFNSGDTYRISPNIKGNTLQHTLPTTVLAQGHDTFYYYMTLALLKDELMYFLIIFTRRLRGHIYVSYCPFIISFPFYTT